MEYYDGSKLLSMKDRNKNVPEIYMVVGNRTGGKTTFFGKYLIERFLENKEKFMLIYRYGTELQDIVNQFFPELQRLFFRSYEMDEKKRVKGRYIDLFLNGEHCGYAVALSLAEKYKKMSHKFADTSHMYLDEFQSDTYVPNEITRFQSLHKSVARGGGKKVRRVPVYMASNTVSLLNPYFVSMGISNNLQSNTKFYRGKGHVLEIYFNQEAAEESLKSGFEQSFANDDYSQHANFNVYLNDNNAFVEKITGRSEYVCTIRYNGKEFGVRLFEDNGIAYVDDRPDKNYPLRFVATLDDHQVNYVMIKKHAFFIDTMRYLFEKGAFRFKNLECKIAALSFLAYH